MNAAVGQAFVYIVALGSNRRHGRHGSPPQVIGAAIKALEKAGPVLLATSRLRRSRPIGPSLRTYANAAVMVSSPLPPPRLLTLVKAIERDFGRRAGQRWGTRVLDLDIILWDGGRWSSPGLLIPHPQWRTRNFVLDPLLDMAPNWRDPATGRSVRQLHYRLRRSVRP